LIAGKRRISASSNSPARILGWDLQWLFVWKRMRRISLPPESRRGDWKDLYMEALFERDKTKLSERIAAAQLAIETRRRELFNFGNPQERQVLDNALFSLQALATCLLTAPRATARGQAA
jgi:hypothetical protein